MWLGASVLDVGESSRTHTHSFGSLPQCESPLSPKHPQLRSKRSLHQVALLSYNVFSINNRIIAHPRYVRRLVPKIRFGKRWYVSLSPDRAAYRDERTPQG